MAENKGSFLTAYVFTLNLITGTGVLAIPYAFQRAGYGLGSIIMLIIAFMAALTMCWHFEVQMRIYKISVGISRGLLHMRDRETKETIVPGNLRSRDTSEVDDDDKIADNDVNQNVSLGSPAPGGKKVVGDRSLQRGGQADNLTLLSRSEVDLTETEAARLLASQQLETANRPAEILKAMVKAQAGRPFDIVRATADDDEEVNPQSLDELLDFEDLDYDDMQGGDFFEVSEATSLFGGQYVTWLWNAVMLLYVESSMWVYVVVVGTTASYGIPFAGTERLECSTGKGGHFGDVEKCKQGYYIFIFVFWLVITGLTMRDWKLMKIIQKVLTATVYGLVLTMIACCIGCGTHKFFMGKTPGNKVGKSYFQPADAFNFSDFADLYGVAIFAMVCHTGTTFVLRNMPAKRIIKRVYHCAFGTVAVFYITLALFVALYIGDSVNQVASINWGNFNEWGIDGGFGYAVGSTILFFPIISITCTSVVFLRSTSDAIEVMLPLAWKEKFVSTVTCGKKKYIPFWVGDSEWSVFPLQFVLRVALTTVPVIIGYISYKFQQAMSVAGFLAFGVSYLIPLILQVMSKRMLAKARVKDVTQFTDPFSSLPMCAFVLVFMLVCAGYYIDSQIIPSFGGKK